jgi:hypothetical protein
LKRLGLSLGIIFIVLALFGCSSNSADILNVDSEGNTSINSESLAEAINQNPLQQPEGAETAGILYMREEEKLARDVYMYLYDTWQTNTFNNIGASEQTHMDAMKVLVDRYSLTDPAQGKAAGVFSDDGLQQLYNGLIAQGSLSEIDALKVGAAIEEIDIIDIEKYIAQTDKQDIITVYENLLKGSRNHLRSFVSVMKNRGVDYEPQYLTEQQFEAIVAGSVEKGKG